MNSVNSTFRLLMNFLQSLDIDDIDFWVEYGLEKARKNEVGIIFSDENLYKFAYLPSMKKNVDYYVKKFIDNFICKFN